MMMGVLELDPDATYPGHRHPSPEVYYIIEGQAQWQVNEEIFEAKPGTAIYHPPMAVHKMVNPGPGKLRAVYFWWAPDGDTEAFEGYEFVEEE